MRMFVEVSFFKEIGENVLQEMAEEAINFCKKCGVGVQFTWNRCELYATPHDTVKSIMEKYNVRRKLQERKIRR
ncbi:MAG: hypothetical protein KAU20_05750 [Nanoarchaeota archaeon]|nr:hypothetical protein [Nanoarchaeota archaeon]